MERFAEIDNRSLPVEIQSPEQDQLQPWGNHELLPNGLRPDNGHRLLSGVAEATRQLLLIENFDEAVNGALGIIAQSADIDRIFIFQHHVDLQNGTETATCPYEWTVPGLIKMRDIPGRFPMAYDNFGNWIDQLKLGYPMQALAKDLSGPAQEIQDLDQAISLLAVPILVDGDYWGNFGFDDCTTERIWSDAEISVLETAAATFASALQRQVSKLDLETYNQQLQKRDRLLDRVSAAAQCLVANDSLEQAIPEALRILGEGTQQDRVYIFENFLDEETGEVFWNVPFEWDAPGIPSQVEAGAYFPVSMNAFPNHINDRIQEGKVVQFLTRDLDGVALELNQKGQSLSLIGVPITISGQWWGVLGFDDCTTERVWSDGEIAVLETAAACIGSAIERDRIRKEREAAAQARAAELEAHNQVLEKRDHVLVATAAAANVLLTIEDFESAVNTALKIIGEGLDVDRINLGEHFDDSTGKSLGYIKFLYEWNSPYAIAQIDHPELAQVSYDGIEYFYDSCCRGETFGGVVDEMPEPFRGGQKSLGVKSTYGVPIMVDGKYWGALAFDDCRKVTRRSEAELAMLKTLANCIGSTIDRDRTRHAREQAERNVLLEREKSAQERAAELSKANEAISQTLSALAADPEINEFLGSLLVELAQQTGACKTHLFLYDAQTHTLKQHSAVEDGQIYIEAAPTHPEMFRHPIPADLTGAWQAMLDSPKPLTFNEMGSLESENLDLWWPETIPWHRREGHCDVACARMQVGEQPVGFIGFAFRDRANLSDEQLEFIQALTNQATLAIQLTRLAEQSQKAALLDERNRLAREIHDTLAQAFTGVSLQLEAVKGMLEREPNEAQKCVNRAGKLARQGLSEARRSVRALRSQALETDDLPQALQKVLKEMTAGSRLQSEFRLEGAPYPLPEDIKINLLRIGQETLTNALRYAQAQTFTLTLQFTHNHIRLEVVDDGKGFEVQSLAQVAGFGLIGIKERAARLDGQFRLTSAPNAGTTIEVNIPIEK